MTTDPAIVAGVEEVYRHIDWVQSAASPPHSSRLTADSCSACGKCCDFDAYDHRLFVTSPELVYLAAKLGHGNIKSMEGGLCPYNSQGKCIIHQHRFAGCRIFLCKGDPDKQAQLSEWASFRFKAICRDHGLAYRYTDLQALSLMR
jgi:Fe-S-cluster containining protein